MDLGGIYFAVWKEHDTDVGIMDLIDEGTNKSIVELVIVREDYTTFFYRHGNHLGDDANVPYIPLVRIYSKEAYDEFQKNREQHKSNNPTAFPDPELLLEFNRRWEKIYSDLDEACEEK